MLMLPDASYRQLLSWLGVLQLAPTGRSLNPWATVGPKGKILHEDKDGTSELWINDSTASVSSHPAKDSHLATMCSAIVLRLQRDLTSFS
jgi:hypothetical protein